MDFESHDRSVIEGLEKQIAAAKQALETIASFATQKYNQDLTLTEAVDEMTQLAVIALKAFD